MRSGSPFLKTVITRSAEVISFLLMALVHSFILSHYDTCISRALQGAKNNNMFASCIALISHRGTEVHRELLIF